jgi:hypothetical protein
MSNSEQREYIGDSKISSSERDWIMNQPDVRRVISEEELLKLAKQASATHERFYRWIKSRMNEQRAQRIRQMRCEDGWSYRSIAGLSYLEWGPDGMWTPLNNQLAGIALCEAAAEQLGEDVEAWPWQANQA